MKIFVIAGEDSGDKLGAAIIDSLRAAIDVSPNFVGIGGSRMISRGLKTIFPMSELSVMGFVEIALQYGNLKKRLNQTVSSILDEKPDILLTIDAPEFCFRVAKKIKLSNDNIPIHIMLLQLFGLGGLTAQKKFQNLLIIFWHFFLLSLVILRMLELNVILLGIQLYQKLWRMKQV